jgi:hypothetical protein
MKRIMASLAIGALFLTAGAAFADSSGTKPVQTPTTGHRGVPTNTYGAPGTATPGGAGAALGSRSTPAGRRVRCTRETRALRHLRIPIRLQRSRSTTSRASRTTAKYLDGAPRAVGVNSLPRTHTIENGGLRRLRAKCATDAVGRLVTHLFGGK